MAKKAEGSQNNNKKIRNYSHIKAMLALTKGSLLSMVRNPSSLIFGLVFPLVMVVIFGYIGDGNLELEVGVLPETNTENKVYKALEGDETVKLVTDMSEGEMNDELQKGEMAALIRIDVTKDMPEDIIKEGQGEQEEQGKQQGKEGSGEEPEPDYQVDPDASPVPITVNIPDEYYIVDVKVSEASQQNGGLFLSLLNGKLSAINLEAASAIPVAIPVIEEVAGREYKSIDFILPGQLGFSVLSVGIMGTAFTFLFLRQTLVLKRFYATPIKRSYIVFGEALSKLLYSMLQITVIIVLGAGVLGFTLVNGVVTFFNMMILAMLGLVIFMGFGFAISSIAKNESAVAPLGNLFMMPQFLLAGTFFPIEYFPSWLQPISKALPLTYLNDALRKIAFEGASFSAISKELIVLAIWGIVVYAVAIKVFKWE